MLRICLGVSLGILILSPTECLARDRKWLIEPIKLTSLMVNTHSEYNGWGFEFGRRLTKRLWVTSMVEKTQGSDFAENFDPAFDYLVSFRYFAWLNTVRFYLSPEKKYSMFLDGGVEFQRSRHKFLRSTSLFEETAIAVGPLLLIGGEWHFSKIMYFKWRVGGFINAYRSGTMKRRIDDGQDQPSFYLYPHLSDAVVKPGSYAGDLALGIKF
jgi:hypothetical protein